MCEIRSVVLLLVLLASSVVSEQIILLENGQAFTTASFSVGNASDFFADFLCTGSGSLDSIWFRRLPSFSQLPPIFDQRTTSYSPSTGLARVFSPYIRDEENLVDGVVHLQCVRGGIPATVDLRPVPNLFFDGEFPTSIDTTDNLVSMCASLLPELPVLTITTSTGTGHAYCEVHSARGSFRSPSVLTEEKTSSSPVFVAEPINITVQPINEVTRGAFSCIVYSGNTVQSIIWYFQPDSGMGGRVAVDLRNGDVLVQTVGGVSVLVLENVGTEREGMYQCEATVEGVASPLISQTAHLTFSTNASVTETVILAPPASLLLPEGAQGLIPCVGSSMPSYTGSSPAAMRGTPSLFGLSISAAARNDRGDIICEVGGDSATVTLSVTAGVRFEEELNEEVIRFLNQDHSPVRLSCEASSYPLPSISFLFNNMPLSTTPRMTVETGSPSCSTCVNRVLRIDQPMAGDEGIYQCLAQQGDDQTTAIVSASYLNLQYLGNPEIYHNDERVEGDLVLNSEEVGASVELVCRVEGHPIPTLSWSRSDGSSAAGVQNISSFRYPAVSVLSVSVNSLSETVTVTCSASLLNLAVEATAITITIFTAVVFTEQPQSTLAPLDEDFVTFSCSATSVPIPVISWFQFRNGIETQLVPGDSVSISPVMMDSTVSSTIRLSAPVDMSGRKYFCRGNNGFSSVDSDKAMIIPTRAPTITTPPIDVLAVEGEVVSFTCVADGLPAPDITLTASPSQPDSSTITSSATTATLEFEAVLSLNNTEVQCSATSDVGTNLSAPAILTIAGVPGVPSLSVMEAARNVTIHWQAPFSLLPLARFLLEVRSQSNPASVQERTLPVAADNEETISSLRPFTTYTVTITTISRAGNSTAQLSFTTLQAAPEAPPTNIMAEAVNTGSIRVSWEAPPIEYRNGEVVGYILQYAPVATPTDKETLNVDGTAEVVVGLAPDTAYQFFVAAQTIALGPFSPFVVQRSYPLPPAPPTDPPGIPDDVAVTMTTIPVTLPKLNTSEFGHMWVVAVKLSETDPSFLLGTPDTHFSDNSSFVFYSQNVPENSAYIVSEIEADRYDSVATGVFVLGDEKETRESNDFPEQYRNGPLEEGRRYIVFVWAFVHPIPASSEDVVARQAENSRQYEVYTSSDFSSPTSTSSRKPTNELSDGEIAGIVISVIAVLIIVLVVVVMAIIFINMWYRRVKNIGPPPTRQGSKRFKEDKSVVTVMSNPNTRPDSALQGLTPDDVRLPILVKDFPDHVRSLHANSDHPFSEEYQLITIKSPGLPHREGSATPNVMKNRYANINAYDETRVCLKFIPGIEGSDFINANYIEGYQKKTVYVAAQGPLPNTVHDFWRMVWEEDSCCIVMLTNINEKGRVKCHQYWPETGSLGLDDITVSVIDTQELAYYTIRTFRVAKGTERREVKQFHYTGWPDFGVPDHPHPVLSFIRRLNNFKRTTRGPDIVHCSAGVGRTGTLITIQAIMQMIEEEGQVDVFNFILGMRRQRSYMVQTERQYIFIHDAVLEVIKMRNTEVPIQNLRQTFKQLQAQNPVTETSKLEEEFLRLNGLAELDETMFSYAMNSLNIPKNRHPHIVPLDMYRVRLIMAPGFSCSDYINASYVDGYQRRHQYILTQGPMHSTVDDFWRMMWEHNVSCVLMLCQNEEKGEEMCVQYWTRDKLKQHGDLFVELTQETSYNNYTMREFSLTNTKINESRLLRHYQYTEWTEDTVPPNSAAVIDLIGVLQKAQHQNGGGPIVLHDSTPIGRAGTFCVLSSVLEQLKVEGVVDIFFFIHALRQQQPGLVASFEQYKFCYTSVLEFLDSFAPYSNFD